MIPENEPEEELLLRRQYDAEEPVATDNDAHHQRPYCQARQQSNLPPVTASGGDPVSVIVSTAIRALFCLQDVLHAEEDNESSSRIGRTESSGEVSNRQYSDQSTTIFILVMVWELCSLSFFTRSMGPGVQYMMIELLLVLCCIIFPPSCLAWLWNHSTIGRRIVWYFLAAVLGLLSFSISDSLDAVLWLWLWTAVLSAIYYLLRRLSRDLQRMAQGEDPPDVFFWQRFDSCLVHVLRAIGVLIVVGYVASLVFIFYDGWWGFWECLLSLFFTSLAFGVLFYFLVLTILVRDRPRRILGEFQSAFSSRQLQRNAIRQARQFVLNPNDPLGEPLLLV